MTARRNECERACGVYDGHTASMVDTTSTTVVRHDYTVYERRWKASNERGYISSFSIEYIGKKLSFACEHTHMDFLFEFHVAFNGNEKI